jgi:catechol 2,3-dioxygenase-like lactoylglutathione lyase family enzyme
LNGTKYGKYTLFCNNFTKKYPWNIKRKIAHIAIVVRDYDEAIELYTQKLGFSLLEDTVLSETKRWVLVAPETDDLGYALLLAKAANETQRQSIGNQSGGRVFLFLGTDDFYRDYHSFIAKGIKFVRQPSHEDYGIVAVLKICTETFGIWLNIKII